MKQREKRHRKTKAIQDKSTVGSEFDLTPAFSRFLSVTGKDILIIAGLALVFLIAGLIWHRKSLEYILSPSSDEVELITEDLDEGIINHKDVVITGNPSKTKFGYTTQPGSSWSITWKGSGERDAVPLVRLHSMYNPLVRNELVFQKGNVVTTVPLINNYAGTLIPARSLISDTTDYSVSFISTALSGLQQPAFTLDRIVIGSRIYPHGELSPNFYQVLMLTLIPAVALLLMKFAVSRNQVVYVGVAIASVVALGLFFIPLLFNAYYWVLTGAVLAILFATYYNRADRPATLGWAEALCAVAVCAAILPLRWKLLMSVVNLPLPADSIDYIRIAREMKHPIDTHYREPAFIWLLRFWFGITAWNPVCIRILTILLSLAGAIATWKVARLFLSPLLAVFAIILFVLNPALLGSSVQGLREELFPLSLLCYVFCGIIVVRTRSLRWIYALIVATGLLPLIRLSALPFVVITTPLILWFTKAGIRSWVVAAVCLLIAVLPFAIYQGSKFGDPMHSSNTYVGTFYKNQEFQGRPEFPTKEEVSRNPWAGEQVGMMKYMFGMHSPGDAITRITKGAYSLLAGKAARTELLRTNPAVTIDYQGWILLPKAKTNFVDFTLVILFVVGLVALCLQPGGWIAVLCILGIQMPLSFLVGSDLIGWRLTMNTIPLMLIVAVYGLSFLVGKARKLLGSDQKSHEVKLKAQGRPS